MTQVRLEPGPLDQESNTITIRSPHLPLIFYNIEGLFVIFDSLFIFLKMFQETTRLQDLRAQKQEELELKHARELEDFDRNPNSGSGPNTFSLKHRSASSISTVSNSSTSSTRSTENNGTVVQQQSNDGRLQVSAGPMRV